jgi:hypothetical protein
MYYQKKSNKYEIIQTKSKQISNAHVSNYIYCLWFFSTTCCYVNLLVICSFINKHLKKTKGFISYFAFIYVYDVLSVLFRISEKLCPIQNIKTTGSISIHIGTAKGNMRTLQFYWSMECAPPIFNVLTSIL